MNNQEMIERYVHEVGQNLPRKMRADIELELRSLLADALEDREEDETAVVSFLKELGSPAQFAAKYLPDQYLIGPNLFQTFKQVGTIIFIVITALTGASILYTLYNAGLPDNLLSWWGQEMNEYVRNIIFLFGFLTLIFFFLDRIGVNAPEKQKEWDPKTLRPVSDPSRIKPFEMITEVGAAFVGIWVLTSLPAWIGTNGGGLFTNGYLVHLPWLIAGSVMEIIMKLAVLKNGRWDKTARTFQVGVNVFDIYVLYRIWSGPILISVEFLDSMVRFGVGVALVIVIVDTAVKVYRLFTTPKEHPIQINSQMA